MTLSPPPDEPVLAAFQEAVGYERLQLTRRRGFFHVSHALVFVGITVANIGVLGPKPWEPQSAYWTRLWISTMILGFSIMACGLLLMAYIRRQNWERLFTEHPTNNRILDWLSDPKRQTVGNMLGFALVAAVLFGGLVILGFNLSLALQLLMGAMMTSGAMGFYQSGRVYRDRALRLLGLGFVIGSVPFWFFELPDPFLFQFVMGLYFGVPLLVLGLYRILATGRWSSH